MSGIAIAVLGSGHISLSTKGSLSSTGTIGLISITCGSVGCGDIGSVAIGELGSGAMAGPGSGAMAQLGSGALGELGSCSGSWLSFVL